MKRKLVALMAFLGSLSLAQSTDTHNVTVNIPQVLKLTLDATDYVFNFGSSASGTVSVNSVDYPRASLTAYEAFLAGSATTQDFAPSAVAGGTNDAYGTLEIVTNQATWTVKIQSIGTPALTLGNDRVKVFAEKASGKGTSQTSSPTAIATNLVLARATTGGQGKSVYKLYYLFEMNINDDIPATGLNESIAITLLVTSP
ncbi:hypothetical protein [Fervidobacterium sp.]